MNRIDEPMVPMRRAFSGDLEEFILTIRIPPIEHSRPSEASASGRNIMPCAAAERVGGGHGHGGGDRDRGDHRAAVGLEDVRAHAGHVADVVTDVIGDNARVARVVFRDTGFDLAHQVGADVGALGVDAAADTREQRDH